jgi:hypothetical protein
MDSQSKDMKEKIRSRGSGATMAVMLEDMKVGRRSEGRFVVAKFFIADRDCL